MNEQILIRFLTNSCSAQEVEQIEQWIAGNEANAAQLFEIERIWSLKDELRFTEEKELKSAYTQLVSRLEKKEASSKRKYALWFRRVGYIAALVLFGLSKKMINLQSTKKK